MLPSAFKLKHDSWWALRAELPSWSDFHCPGAASSSVEVRFAPEGRGAEPLATAELALAQWLFDNETEVSAAVKQALVDAYPEIQAVFGGEGDDREEMLPEISSVDDLKSRVALQCVNVHQVSKEGVPYLGFEFSCTWDREHGLGVLMHGTRPVEVGGADTAILLWLAERDAKQSTLPSGAQ